jgi:acetyl-CoA acyltransferase
VTLARAKLAEEIVPVPIPPKFQDAATKDNGVRENQTMEALAKLKPYFDRRFGTVTAGNSSQITDGGAAVLLMSASAARSRGYAPLGKIRGFAFCALEPERMGLGPAVAVPLALEARGRRVEGRRPRRDQRGLRGPGPRVRARVPVRGVAREVRDGGPIGEIDWERTNVNGGAIALGHPVGSSANRLVTTLLKEMSAAAPRSASRRCASAAARAERWSWSRCEAFLDRP